MDQELYAFLEESRRLTSEQIERLRTDVGRLREETGRRFAQLEERIAAEGRNGEHREGLREEVRHTRVLLEAARDEVRLLGEGMMGLNETTSAFRGEVRGQLAEIRAVIAPLYQNLRERLENLEERSDRQTRDVLDVLRERYGKPQTRL